MNWTCNICETQNDESTHFCEVCDSASPYVSKLIYNKKADECTHWPYNTYEIKWEVEECDTIVVEYKGKTLSPYYKGLLLVNEIGIITFHLANKIAVREFSYDLRCYELGKDIIFAKEEQDRKSNGGSNTQVNNDQIDKYKCLNDDYPKLQEKYQSTLLKLSESKKKIQELRDTISSKEDAIKKLKEEKKNIEKVSKEANKDIQKLRSSISSKGEEIVKLTERNEKNERIIEEIKNKLDKSQSASLILGALAVFLLLLSIVSISTSTGRQKQLAEISSELSRKQNSAISLRNKMQKKDNEILKKENEISQLRNEKNEFQNKCQQMEERVDYLEKENMNLKAEIEKIAKASQSTNRNNSNNTRSTQSTQNESKKQIPAGDGSQLYGGATTNKDNKESKFQHEQQLKEQLLKGKRRMIGSGIPTNADEYYDNGECKLWIDIKQPVMICNMIIKAKKADSLTILLSDSKGNVIARSSNYVPENKVAQIDTNFLISTPGRYSLSIGARRMDNEFLYSLSTPQIYKEYKDSAISLVGVSSSQYSNSQYSYKYFYNIVYTTIQ